MKRIFNHWLGKPINYRNYLPHLLIFLKLDGIGVEIGVEKGEFSELILLQSNLELLYSVDPWKHFPDKMYKDPANLSQEQHEENLRQTEERLGKFGDRSRIFRMESIEAVNLFCDGELDFVYIDANHLYPFIKNDIEIWFPKVMDGGILAGHDYMDSVYEGVKFNVKTAVNEFIEVSEQKLYVTEEMFPTWYLIKHRI